MRWNEPPRREPVEEPDTEVVDTFLLFPKSINGVGRWWEQARYKRRKTWVLDGDGLCTYSPEWVDEAWLDDPRVEEKPSESTQITGRFVLALAGIGLIVAMCWTALITISVAARFVF